jgi:hypothetical protein
MRDVTPDIVMDVSKEHIASIFRFKIKTSNQQSPAFLPVAVLGYSLTVYSSKCL